MKCVLALAASAVAAAACSGSAHNTAVKAAPANIMAACAADVTTVDHAVQAYAAQVGTEPASISALTSPKTVGGAQLGPWLTVTPTNSGYTVQVGAGGSISVRMAGSRPAVYTPGGGRPPPAGVTPQSVCS